MVGNVLDVRQNGEAVLDFPAHRIPLGVEEGGVLRWGAFCFGPGVLLCEQYSNEGWSHLEFFRRFCAWPLKPTLRP